MFADYVKNQKIISKQIKQTLKIKKQKKIKLKIKQKAKKVKRSS